MPTVKINGVRIACEVHGSGEPVLFLHGFPLSGKLWESLIEPLRGKWRLILPDLRGMGLSEATAEASMADYADDAAALLEQMNLPKAVVVGLSMGGYIAFEFNRRHAACVRALVFADTRAEPDAPEAAKSRRETAENVLREGPAALVETMLPKLFAAGASETLRATWRQIMLATPKEGVAAALRAMADRPDSLPDLATIAVPTLVVVGAEDTLTPPANAKTIADGIPGAQLEIIPGAGHMVPVEQPAKFAEALKTFLAPLPRG